MGYTIRITIHECLDERREQKRRDPFEGESLDEIISEANERSSRLDLIADYSSNPETTVTSNEYVKYILSHIKEEKDRSAFVLVIIEERTLQEAAEILGTYPVDIQRRVKKAKKQVKRYLDNEKREEGGLSHGT